MGRTFGSAGPRLHRVRGASFGWAAPYSCAHAPATLPYADRAGRQEPRRRQASRSSRPGRISSQVRRLRSRRGGPAGRPSPGWTSRRRGRGAPSARRSSVGPASSSARVPGAGSGASGAEAGERADRGRRQDPRGHPLAEVELLGAGDRERHDRGVGAQRDDRPAGAERARPAGRTADRALGHLDEDAAVGDHGPRRGDVLVDADPAAPDGQQAAEVVDQPLAPARGERRRAAPQEPGTWLGRQARA